MCSSDLLAVRGTFSPSGPARHTAGAGLTRTLGHAKLNCAGSCRRVEQPQMQIARRPIHPLPAALAARVPRPCTTSAPNEPSPSAFVLRWLLLLAGHDIALLAVVVRLAEPRQVSLLARSRVAHGGLLVAATRLREIPSLCHVAQSETAHHNPVAHRATRAVGKVRGTVGVAWPNPSFKRTRSGKPALALISFWAKAGLPPRAA